MYRILLPVDTDVERAKSAAEFVTGLPAAAEEISVTVLHVRKRMEVDTGDSGRISSDDWFEESDVPDSVAEAERVLEDAGVDVRVRHIHANPSEAIKALAEDTGSDQIVLTGRNRSPVGKLVFGSVAQDVMLQSTTPATVVPER